MKYVKSQNHKSSIPKIIWTYWGQGADQQPHVIQKCISSWKAHNKDWDVIVLDETNTDQYVRLELPHSRMQEIGLTKQSDLLRLQLLEKHGGVWADATVFCTTPLDSWLSDYIETGFFAFRNPGPDRLLSTWFLASEKNLPVISNTKTRFIKFFSETHFDNESIHKKLIHPFVRLLLNRSSRTTKFWMSDFVAKRLKIYPYFILHYLFERSIKSDMEFWRTWNSTKMISAYEPHAIFNHGLTRRINSKIKFHIDNKKSPLYKLSWKFNKYKLTSESAISYLFDTYGM